MWTQQEGIELCCEIERISPNYGYHVALTGGLLYKDGERKDCDILFYSIRQWEMGEDLWQGLKLELIKIGFESFRDTGFVTKSIYKGKTVDIFFPEAPRNLGNGYGGSDGPEET